MKYVDFSPFAVESIEVEFECPDCHSQIHYGPIGVPSPNFAAEKSKDSTAENDDTFECQNCQKEYAITVAASFNGGYIMIDGLEDDSTMEVIENDEEPPFEFDAILSNSDYFLNAKTSLENLRKLLSLKETLSEELKVPLYHMLYANAITILETFLSDCLANKVFDKDEPALRQFVEKYKPFDDKQIPISELFSCSDKIETLVKKELLDIIYHNLPKVSNIYRQCLNIDMPDISSLSKSIAIRHDIVHRSGKTKDGDNHAIDDVQILQLCDDVLNFVTKVNEKLNPMPF